MAGMSLAAVTPEISIAATGVEQTLLQIVAPTNQRVRIREISVSFKGTSNTASPIKVTVLRQSNAGTGGTSLTLVKWDTGLAETIQTTALNGIWATTEPTAGDIDMIEEVHPQTGFLWQAPFGGELMVPGGTRMAIRANAGAAVTATARMVIEE